MVLAAVVVLVPRMPRWDRVKKSFFDVDQMRDSFPRLIDAFWLDVKIFAWTTPAIFVLAMLIALARNSRSPALFPVRAFAAMYTDVMRGVPVILWIYLVGFGVPGLGLERPYNSPLLWGSVALAMTYSGYVAEVFRAGIASVHESQRAAARSLGLSSAQTMRFVVLPQAWRVALPALGNEFISLILGSSLASAVTLQELFSQGRYITNATYRQFEVYAVLALVYFLLTFVLSRLVRALEARLSRGVTLPERRVI